MFGLATTATEKINSRIITDIYDYFFYGSLRPQTSIKFSEISYFLKKKPNLDPIPSYPIKQFWAYFTLKLA